MTPLSEAGSHAEITIIGEFEDPESVVDPAALERWEGSPLTGFG
ncbi:MAG TPA: hypothetical protein VMO47_03115 [Rhodothermales bacterium]|nr:hypothetical protein [Rhodothermales bacterium]